MFPANSSLNNSCFSTFQWVGEKKNPTKEDSFYDQFNQSWKVNKNQLFPYRRENFKIEIVQESGWWTCIAYLKRKVRIKSV